MSADNWAICPRCKKNAEDASVKLKLAAGKSYGKVTPEEYLAKLEEANQPVAIDQTFREDYGLGVGDDGEFYVSYKGHCDTCGLSHEFKHEESLDLASTKKKP